MDSGWRLPRGRLVEAKALNSGMKVLKNKDALILHKKRKEKGKSEEEGCGSSGGRGRVPIPSRPKSGRRRCGMRVDT